MRTSVIIESGAMQPTRRVVRCDALCEERRNTLTVKLNKAGKKCVTNSVSKSVT